MPRWWLAIVGITALITGIAAFAWPELTAVILVIIIGTSAIVSGVVEIIGAIELRRSIADEWLLILSGIISVLFGIAVVIAPGAGALVLIWLICTWAIVFGALTMGLTLRLRTFNA